MQSDWPEVPLSYICSHSAFGPRFSGELYSTDGNIATLRTTDISEDGRIEYMTMPRARLDSSRFRQHLLQKDDLVVTRTGRVGTTAVFNSFSLPVLPGAFLIRFRLKADIADPQFYRYYFNSSLGRRLVQSVATGSVQQNLNITSLHGLRILLPPLHEQGAIAHILGTLDDKIELNRRMNETLEATARAIFKSWFVDFDPVRAKAEGRQPFGMDAATAALFPDSFIDSPVGKIPKGWRVGSIGEIVANPRRGVEPKEIADGTPYIALEHMPQRSIALAKWGLADKVVSNKFEFRQGEILFGKLRPYFHKVGVAVLDGVCSTDILVIKPKSEEWIGLVLGHVSSKEFIDHTDAVSTGTKMPRTNWQDMARYEIALPDSRLANVFGHFVRTLVEMIRQNILQSHTLAAIRDALLPKLISGEIRVRATHHPAEVATL
jgi:type I restriction enzyme, S subunit